MQASRDPIIATLDERCRHHLVAKKRANLSDSDDLSCPAEVIVLLLNLVRCCPSSSSFQNSRYVRRSLGAED